MRYRVTHVTKYTGDEPVSVGHNEARLQPRQLPHQRCERHELAVSPTPSVQTSRNDYFGNVVACFSFNHGYDTLTVKSASEVSLMRRPAPPFGGASPVWEWVRDDLRRHRSPRDLHACEFTFDSPQAGSLAELADYAQPSFSPGCPIVEAVTDLTARIRRDFRYMPQSTHVATRVQDVFRSGRGVCQDFAHLQIAALRSLGLAARYVSGYLRTYPPPGKPRLVGADASHAWLSVYCGEPGWIDVDPTNNMFPDQEHITVGWGRDFLDVSPLRGVYIGGGHHQLNVSVDVEPLGDDFPEEEVL
jgi:transglutaminase-like putative cysteine protease